MKTRKQKHSTKLKVNHRKHWNHFASMSKTKSKVPISSNGCSGQSLQNAVNIKGNDRKVSEAIRTEAVRLIRFGWMKETVIKSLECAYSGSPKKVRKIVERIR